MSLIARLRAYAVEALGIGASEARDSADDTHLAATALLVHVARVDGILAPAESERLARLVEGRYADGPPPPTPSSPARPPWTPRCGTWRASWR